MSAVFSACEVYRYRLERTVSEDGPTYGFFGVNPSTADAQIDDHTVRKWRGFTQTWGGSRFLVGNVFGYRAKDVSELAGVVDPIGPHNDRHLKEIARDADVLVPCWGKVSKVPARVRSRFDDVLAMLRASGKPVMHLGLTACGSPKHPLALAYVTKLAAWN